MPGLEQLHPYNWRPLLELLDLEDKKSLRLVSWTLYNLVNENDDALKYVYREKAVTPAALRQMADDCPTILGLECEIDLTEDDSSMHEALLYLADKHQEVKEIKFTSERTPLHFQGLRGLFRLENLKTLEIRL